MFYSLSKADSFLYGSAHEPCVNYNLTKPEYQMLCRNLILGFYDLWWNLKAIADKVYMFSYFENNKH